MSLVDLLLYLFAILCTWSGHVCIVCHQVSDGAYPFPDCTVHVGGEETKIRNTVGELYVSTDPWQQAITFKADFRIDKSSVCSSCEYAVGNDSNCNDSSQNVSLSVRLFDGGFNFVVAAFCKNTTRNCYASNPRVEKHFLGPGPSGQVTIPLKKLLDPGKENCTEGVEIFTLFALDTDPGKGVIFALADEDRNTPVECNVMCPLLGTMDCLLISHYGVISYYPKAYDKQSTRHPKNKTNCICVSLKDCIATYSSSSRLPVVCGAESPWAPTTRVPTGIDISYMPYSVLRRILLEQYHIGMLNLMHANDSCLKHRSAVESVLQFAAVHLENSCFNVHDSPSSKLFPLTHATLAKAVLYLKHFNSAENTSCNSCDVDDKLVSEMDLKNRYRSGETVSNSAHEFFFVDFGTGAPLLRNNFLVLLAILGGGLLVGIMCVAMYFRCRHRDGKQHVCTWFRVQWTVKSDTKKPQML